MRKGHYYSYAKVSMARFLNILSLMLIYTAILPAL